MANKFTKSVLERQAKERRQHPDGQAAGERAAPAAAGAPAAPAAPAAPEAAAQPVPAAQDRDIQPEAAAPEAERPAPQAPAGGSLELPLSEQPKTRSKHTKAAPAVDLTAFIVRDEGRSAKNKTFYLDAAVIDALHRAAVAQKVTDSKLVNDILKKLLGV
ncbi:hypothetical protein [Anaerotruncus sp.]|uniref:hypothetical protein n=1 Tax=Anaerotruncus TaxID=244127 RepID=UPI00216EBDE9|nr:MULTISPECIES: hypothetical protein [Anaerotruncus]MCI8493853.1 hypothetical protein [Anaerotruncus sp.]